MMAKLAANNQLIVVTHLAQIAGMPIITLNRKNYSSNESCVTISLLKKDDVSNEIQRMVGGEVVASLLNNYVRNYGRPRYIIGFNSWFGTFVIEYDSAGITVLSEDEISVWKKPGKVHVLAKQLEQLNIQSNVGIGHTRWATHGTMK